MKRPPQLSPLLPGRTPLDPLKVGGCPLQGPVRSSRCGFPLTKNRPANFFVQRGGLYNSCKFIPTHCLIPIHHYILWFSMFITPKYAGFHRLFFVSATFVVKMWSIRSHSFFHAIRYAHTIISTGSIWWWSTSSTSGNTAWIC